jgi:SAM-dependent methyltransferase
LPLATENRWGESVTRRTAIWGGVAVAALALAALLLLRPASLSSLLSALSTRPERELDVIFVTTPPAAVKAMLDIAKVGPSDFVVDLGSGDGRIPIAAARDYGARALGIELDPALVEQSRQNARQAGVADRVQFVEQSFFEADIGEATVVTLFLLPPVNLRLRPKLWKELKPGTRVVSYQFHMGDWRPDQVLEVEEGKVFYWVIPADAKDRQ